MNTLIAGIVGTATVAATPFVVSAAVDTSVPLRPRMTEIREIKFNDDYTLKDVILIGTHGSAAYRIDSSIVVDDRGKFVKHIATVLPGFVAQWAKNQHYDIYSQLCLGVRFLHLEVAVYQGRWVCIHSYYAGELSDDITQVVRFIEDHPDGFALIHVQTFGNTFQDSADKTAWEFIKGIVDDEDMFVSYIRRDTKMSDLKGKIVLMLPNNDNDKQTKFHYYPQDYTADKDKFMENRTQSSLGDRSHYVHPSMLQWVMTPGTTEMVNDITDIFAQGGLHKLPAVSDVDMRKNFLEQNKEYLVSNFDVFIVDHVDSNAIDDVHGLNSE